VETTDKWLRLGNPWEIARPELTYDIKFGGHTEPYRDTSGRYRVAWIPSQVVRGTPFDTPILGYRVNNANLLRLWKADACESFDFGAFNSGDYYGAVEEKMVSENLTKILYPNDEPMEGKRLRLQQQFFFVSCSLQDMIRIHQQKNGSLSAFHAKFAVQLNDTHPAIGIAELMRLLVDEHQMDWEPAWDVTTRTFGYTNHTLMPEALERWSLPLFRSVLPRHTEIIYEINQRFLDQVRLATPDPGKISRLSLIDETGEKFVRMANLACVGSYSINGVARLHTELVKQSILKDFYELWPEKFSNKTNGVTPRRFLILSNPGLAGLIGEAIGESWRRDLSRLEGLLTVAHDRTFQARWRVVKQGNKQVLADIIRDRVGVVVDPESLFDVQVKRIHEYKRQHLNVLHVITLYNRIRRGMSVPPRTVIFGGKAAPGYFMAKLIIKLIHGVAEVVNNDPAVKGLLKVVFLPDFNVKHAQHIYPAADLSEQISTAGLEASGTGNMKFSLNGALTIGTLDGANVEIREAVGAENFFLFGLSTPEVQALRQAGYRPLDFFERHPELREAMDQVGSGVFSKGDGALFRPLTEGLLLRDPFMLLADYASYVETQKAVGDAYRKPEVWSACSIRNVAKMGYFSSDRAIQEYCDDIWKVKPVPISL
jgi:starch phosphorylase